MSLAAPFCPRCGLQNRPDSRFCERCGSPLALVASPGSFAPGYPPTAKTERRDQIEKTKSGLILLLIGFLLSGFPYVLFVGFILIFVSIIFLLLGRAAFGSAHERNVTAALFLFLGGIVATIALFLYLLFAFIRSALSQGTLDPQVLADNARATFTNYLLGTIIISAVAGLSSVLYTYSLQKSGGKALLLGGYAAGIGVAVANYIILVPLVTDAVDKSIQSGFFDPTPFLQVQAQLTILGILAVIPSVVFALATYLAWTRVSSGELPGPPTPWPSTPPGLQPPVPPP